MKKLLLICILLIGLISTTIAKDLYVKYRGVVNVSNGHFQHLNLKPSSFINNMYYDKKNKYLLVQLRNTYYHYCSIPQNVISSWIGSPSLGRYYNYKIKGNYDCRINPVPQY